MYGVLKIGWSSRRGNIRNQGKFVIGSANAFSNLLRPGRDPEDKVQFCDFLMNAVLIIDKPAGLTSHDVVNRVRRILGEKSVGHLGTLDPLATGVLPLVFGNLTRLAQFYCMSEKVYEGI